MRQRAERLTHIHQTHRQSTRPESGQKIAYQAHRAGGAERFSDPAVPTRIAVDLAWLRPADARRRARAWSVLTTATPHPAHTRSWLRTGPGIGALLRLVLLDDRPDIPRFPRGQDVGSSCRLGTWAQASAGQRDGTGGTKSGHADRQGALSDAAGRLLRDHPPGQTDLPRRANTHGQGKALAVLAPHVARAVDAM